MVVITTPFLSHYAFRYMRLSQPLMLPAPFFFTGVYLTPVLCCGCIVVVEALCWLFTWKWGCGMVGVEIVVIWIRMELWRGVYL